MSKAQAIQAIAVMCDRPLHELHNALNTLQSNPIENRDAIASLRQHIRHHLPPTSIGTALPQKKTPSGNTRVLHLNYTRSKAEHQGETELEHFRFIAHTATRLGIKLDVLTTAISRADIETELRQAEYATLTYTITESCKPISKWAEDSVEYLVNGTVAVLHPVNDTLLEHAMVTGRRERWQGKISDNQLEDVLQDDSAWIPLGIRVNSNNTGTIREQLAQENGQPVSLIRTYIEGGNMITGDDITGNPVILVGRDAISTTAYLYQLSEYEVRQLICDDFALDHIDQVICVEQPGQFHLDMGLLFIGNGVVIVNDSSAARTDAIEMAELVPCMTTQTLAAKLTLQCNLEASAVNDLTTAGLTVIRESCENGVFYNFFNGEFVTGADGRNYYITNGGPSEQEAHFTTHMVTEWNVVEAVFFSPQSAAQKSLQEKGGIGCRLKGAPQ